MIKYQIILADPPWQYQDKRKGSLGGAENHYPTMTIDEICNLPIKEIAEDNALLFLWVTFPTLTDGLKVFEAWGFKYKTLGFAWIKTNKRQDLQQKSFLPTDNIDDFFGIGHYTKSNCEVCLIGVRGKGHKLVKSKKISSTVIAPRQEHSKKPNEVRKRIVQLCGDVSRIELFARNKTDGWDSWGNEVKCDINLNN